MKSSILPRRSLTRSTSTGSRRSPPPPAGWARCWPRRERKWKRRWLTSRASRIWRRAGSRFTALRTRVTASPGRRSPNSSPMALAQATSSSGRTYTTCSKPPWISVSTSLTCWRRPRSRMPDQLLLLVTILIALGFDFTNGFHDTANAIATSVSTRAMSPRMAVLIAAVLNLAGAVITVVFFQAKVSNTIGKIVAFKVGLVVIIAALVGAIAWNLITWYLGLPSSSTHALVGALSGAAIAAVHGVGGVRASEFWKTVLSLLISPPAGFILAAVVMTLLLVVLHRARPVPLNRTFRNLQILTAALVSYSHGANDAQKTMAVITLALVGTGHLQKFQVPVWVVLLSASAIAFGTYAGGWRIIRTLGWRIYKLDPATGFAAQLTGAAVIQFATQFGLPVSTTHVVTGSVMGAGASQRLSALRWGVGANIVLAWVLTIPASALIAWVVYAILNTAGLRG